MVAEEFVFVSGRPSLDLAGTLKWRRSDPVELLATPGSAARWTVAAGVVEEPPQVDDGGLVRLVALREAVYRLAVDRAHPARWDAGDLRLLDEAARAAPVAGRLQPGGGLLRTGDLTAVLSTLARDAAELLGGAEAARIRECAGEHCTRLFVDSSRGAPRRWCGMAECGNRAKAASYRRRRRAAEPGNRLGGTRAGG